MKPLIGVTGYYIDHSELGDKGLRGLPGQDMAMYSYDYIRSIQRAGATAILLPVEDSTGMESLLNRIDGVLFAGGADINPHYYGENPCSYLGAVEEERDQFELALARKALERDLPILGICRGLQLLNVAAGGTLYQDLQREKGEDYAHSLTQFRKWQGSHEVQLQEESRIHKAFGEISFKVNSFHHQAIKTVGKGFTPTAWAHDQVIEAIESDNHSYIVAVQWHPEMMSEKDSLQQKLFNHFVHAALTKM